MPKRRADIALVERGLVDSRALAQAAIREGRVHLGGRPIDKPSTIVSDDADLALAPGGCPWASRAGLKLAHALDHFGVNPRGAHALDLGASTGGFTDVLLARGAAHVTAIDVGHGQLHPKLLADRRMTAIERLNARDLTPAHLGYAPDLIVADLSFISLTKALPPALSLAAPRANLIALIKPQFEAGPAAVGKGGIVRDPLERAKACAVIVAMLDDLGWSPRAAIESPITGGDGNVEYLTAATGPGERAA